MDTKGRESAYLADPDSRTGCSRSWSWTSASLARPMTSSATSHDARSPKPPARRSIACAMRQPRQGGRGHGQGRARTCPAARGRAPDSWRNRARRCRRRGTGGCGNAAVAAGHAQDDRLADRVGQRTFGPFVGTADINVMHSVVDILGLNRVARPVFHSAAAGVSGAALAYEKSQGRRRLRPGAGRSLPRCLETRPVPSCRSGGPSRPSAATW
jgi:hypothetical protein